MQEALTRDDAAQLYRQARQHWSAGRKDQAELAYRQAIDADPEYGYPHYDLAHLLEGREGRSSEIISHYRRFLELCADDQGLERQVERARSRLRAPEATPASPDIPPDASDAARRHPHRQEPVAESAETAACSGLGPAAEALGQVPESASSPEQQRLPLWAIVLLCAATAILVMSVVLAIVLITRSPSVRQGRLLATPTAVVSRTHAQATASVPPTFAVTSLATEAPTPLPTTPTEAEPDTVSVAALAALAATETPSSQVHPPQAGQTVQLTPGATAIEAPAEELSGRLAFPVFDADRGTYDIFMTSADGTGMQRLLEEASQPAFSADGQRSAFRRWKAGERGIQVVDVAGGNPVRLTSFPEDSLPSWSPDGQALFFFSRRESVSNVRIYSVKTDG